MRGLKKQSGFSLIELMVGMTILIIVFGGSFMVLNKARVSARARDTAGPHLFFETFASSRLRLYYSKLMQWVAHAGAQDCSDALRFAFASNDAVLAGGPPANDQAFNNRTLGADMRMALSTLDYAEVAANPLTGRLNQGGAAWGALVPFSTRLVRPSAIMDANANLASFCNANEGVLEDSQGAAREFCNWVDTCSGQDGNRAPQRPLTPDITNDGVNYLSPRAGVSSLNNLSSFRMCFAFVGNLFSRTGNVVNGAAARELEVIDNPSVLGLAVATATFRNSNTGQAITCNQAVNEMHRTLNVRLNLYTVLNAESSVASKKQLAFKTMKEFSSEKIGVSVPNCSNRPPIPVNGLRPVCIAAPLWLYQCREECADPVPIVAR